MPKYHIWTIGCQMNKAESEALNIRFAQLGYETTDIADEADVIILNSCVVRESAENRVVNKLKALRVWKKAHPGVKLALTGCLVGANVAQLQKSFPHVDHFFRAGETPKWLEGEKIQAIAAVPDKVAVPCTYVSIIQGCNNFCSYCIVPFRRGRERSRPMTDIVCEVRELARRGVREVTLLGQNVNSYGHDLAKGGYLSDLLKELNGIDDLYRIRFLTNHPKDLSDSLIDAMASLNKVCENINLPVQAGDNDILKLMRRDHTVEQYRELVGQLRNRVKGLALSTDIIVGFPGETEVQFENTMKLLKELRFDMVHVAAYSPRAGTASARELDDDVPAEEKKRRLDDVEALQAKIKTELNASLLGQEVEVLVEEKKDDKWKGRTRTDKLVFLNADDDLIGHLVHVTIEKTGPWSLQGKMNKRGV